MTRGSVISSPRLWSRIAGSLAIIAGIVHFLVTPEHFDESTWAGLFMIGAGSVQVGLGFLIATRPSRFVVATAIATTLVIFAVYGVSRTVGVPASVHGSEETIHSHGVAVPQADHSEGFFGWVREPVGRIDLLSKGLELAMLASVLPVIRHLRLASGSIDRGSAYRGGGASR